MTKSLQPLIGAAALMLTVLTGSAAAQTVYVTNAAPRQSIEVVVNGTTAGAATTDALGDAAVPIHLEKTAGKTEIDATVYVDTCGTTRRILIIERGAQLPPVEAGCERRDAPGLYWVRTVNTVVVDVGGVNPAVLLIKGAYNPRTASATRSPRRSPTGLVVFGSAGISSLRDAVTLACGNVADCGRKGSKIAYTAGATYWLTRFLGAEATFLEPANVNVHGNGDTYRFDSALDTRMATIAALGGAPIGPVRLYGKFGVDYHQAITDVTETIDDVTVTVDGVQQTFPGGTQKFRVKTNGWSWLFGGGGEVWATSSFALYGEFVLPKLKGKDVTGGEGQIDDRATVFLFGARVHIGR